MPIVGRRVRSWQAFWKAGKGTWDVPRRLPTWEQLFEGVEAHHFIHNSRVFEDLDIAADMQVTTNLHVASCLADADTQSEEFQAWNKPWFHEKDGEWWCDLCKKWATATHIGSRGHLERTRRQPANNTASVFGVGLAPHLRIIIEEMAFRVTRLAVPGYEIEKAHAGNPYYAFLSAGGEGYEYYQSLLQMFREGQFTEGSEPFVPGQLYVPDHVL